MNNFLKPNRMICEVFREMRTCLKTNNFSYLKGLIEEAQSYANRMESALHSIDTNWHEKNIKLLQKTKQKLKCDIAKLKKKQASLKNVIKNDQKNFKCTENEMTMIASAKIPEEASKYDNEMD